jgi:hypothetical protein
MAYKITMIGFTILWTGAKVNAHQLNASPWAGSTNIGLMHHKEPR